MRRFLVMLSLLLVPLSAFAVLDKGPLPAWLRVPPGFKVDSVKYWNYDEQGLFLDNSPLPKDAGGYSLTHGEVWGITFTATDKKADCNQELKRLAVDELQKQGFHFANSGKSTLQKGDGANATYVHFYGSDCGFTVIETAPDPWTLTLKAPAPKAEPFGEKADIPYLAPIAGSTLKEGRNDIAGSWPQPRCAEGEERGTTKTERSYQAPAELSNFALVNTYAKAFREAGWDEVCVTSGHELKARFTKNGRDIGVRISGQLDWSRDYFMQVVDTGAGFRRDLEKNCKASLYGVNFDFNKATLRPDAEPALNQLLSVLKDQPKLVVEIGGHTDNVGKPDYNLKLSDERAAAVRQWLIGHDIAASRLSSHGYGDTQPLVPNTDDENRAKNRRVEVKRTDCK